MIHLNQTASALSLTWKHNFPCDAPGRKRFKVSTHLAIVADVADTPASRRMSEMSAVLTQRSESRTALRPRPPLSLSLSLSLSLPLSSSLFVSSTVLTEYCDAAIDNFFTSMGSTCRRKKEEMIKSEKIVDLNCHYYLSGKQRHEDKLIDEGRILQTAKWKEGVQPFSPLKQVRDSAHYHVVPLATLLVQ